MPPNEPTRIVRYPPRFDAGVPDELGKTGDRKWCTRILREIPQAYVPLVWVAFVVAIFTYFIDWSTVRRRGSLFLYAI